MFKKVLNHKSIVTIVVLILTLVFTNIMADNKEHADVQLWKNGTFHQETVDMSKYADGIIKAKVDGKWQEFKVTNLPERFMKWNLKSRLKSLEKLKEKTFT